jgi:hypothetical protein
LGKAPSKSTATLDKRLEAKICCERFDALKMLMLELEGA